VRDIYTAPYTEDAAQLQPRRLRSDPYQGMGLNFVVGCGYAAREGARDQTVVVRLADGVAWILDDTPDWTYGRPLAITCEEIFWDYNESKENFLGGMTSIARIRLADLGPGLPPD
ncbi:MAG: hypothetical protein IT376_16215, partial [Polyangiaceae bacterium]|nr:hypothetical protein [Polyangiaceae bacterium]